MAIALAQALLPVLIRTRFAADSGLLTGAFSMALVLGSVIAAGAAVPLEEWLGGWEWSLAFWALPALLAAVVWLPAALRPGTTVARGGGAPLRGSGLAWAVSAVLRDPVDGVLRVAVVDPLDPRGRRLVERGGGRAARLRRAVRAVPAFLVPVLAARAPDQMRVLLAIVLVPWPAWRACSRCPASRRCGWSRSASARAARSGSR